MSKKTFNPPYSHSHAEGMANMMGNRRRGAGMADATGNSVFGGAKRAVGIDTDANRVTETPRDVPTGSKPLPKV
jgi:hypothetical protein